MSEDIADNSNSNNMINQKTDKVSDDVTKRTAISHSIMDILSGYGVCALLISDPVNLRYLSGFTGGEGYLFIMASNNSHNNYVSDDSGIKKYLIVDSRYGVRASEECAADGIYDGDGMCSGSDIKIIVENERIKAINNLIKKESVKRIALEGKHITYDIYKKLSKELDAGLVMCDDEVDKLRLIKTQAEISMIKKAEDIGCMAFEHILSYIRPGVAERDIALELEYFMKKNGAEALSFDTIVAAGVNSSCPHASASDRKIENGDFVTLDFGCVYKGYCSDMTRTIAVGHIDTGQKKIYETVLSAQQNALKNIRIGITGREADSFAREIINVAGFAKNFGHGTGHGVGLYIHELPRVAPSSDDILDAGMVFSVEPGIYLDGEYGVRIEDVVALTEDGIINLTKATKELIVL